MASPRTFDFKFECDIPLPAGLAPGQQITIPGGLELAIPNPLGFDQNDVETALIKSACAELSGNGTAKESIPSLMPGGESSTDHTTTNTGTLAQTQTFKSIQTTIEIKNRVIDSRNLSTSQASVSPEPHIRSSKALQATRESGATLQARAPKNRITSRLQKLDTKKAKRMVNENDPRFCPGLDKCRSLTCNHTNLRNATPYEVKEAQMNGKAQVVVDECHVRGYKATLGYAREQMNHLHGYADAIASACIKDIDYREAVLRNSGRFPFPEEKVAAIDTTGRDERDTNLDWMEKEERLYKDVEKNGERSVWAMRAAYAIDPAEGQRWYDASMREAKYRTSRRKHFEVLRTKVTRGEITLEHMNTCLSRIDGAQVQIRLNSYREFIANRDSAKLGDVNGIPSTRGGVMPAAAMGATSFAMHASIVAGLAPFGSNTLLSLPIRVVGPANDKPKAKSTINVNGSNKQAYVEDGDELDGRSTITEEVLRARVGEAFKVLYDCNLPSFLELRLIERFANTLPIFDPDPVEITEMRCGIDGGARLRAFVADLFETHVLRAELCMDPKEYFPDKDLDVPDLVKEEERIAPLGVATSSEKDTMDETELDTMEQLDLEEAIKASLKDTQPVTRAAPTEGDLFKSMAKAKMESKRKEDGTFDDELAASEMRARAMLASGGASEASQANNNALASTASANGVNGGGVRRAYRPADHILYRIKLARKNGEMTWPPHCANFKAVGFDAFLAFQDAKGSKLLRALAMLQIDIVGGFAMVEDGFSKDDDVAFIKELTTITNNHVAHIFLGLGSKCAALATRLYQKFEVEVNQYFVEQGIVPTPADFENEALRFGIWMYMARDLDTDNDNKAKEVNKESKLEQLGKQT